MKNTSYFELEGSVLRIPQEGGKPRVFDAETGRWLPYDHVERFIVQAIDISHDEAQNLIEEERKLAGV
jgi:hypothetical protein